MERRLGRGLGALLSKPAGSDEPQTQVELDAIQPNPFQPRVHFEEEGLAELKASIEAHGVLQPVVLRRCASGAPDAPSYELISGERRWRASRLAGKATIPAVIRDSVSDEDMLELALVENVQRRDLDPIERARGYRQLQERLGLTQEGVAARVGLKRSTVANHLRLLDLPNRVQDAVGQNLLSMGHARALLGVEDDTEQETLMEAVVRGDLSVRETERRVRERTKPKEAAPEPEERAPRASTTEPEPWVREIETRLRESLGTKVKLVNGPDYRGQIVLEYYDQASLDSLIHRLAPRRTV